MGIFDALTFNPQGYGGQGGGLLDMLRSFQMQQQYQPSNGFGDAAMPPGAQPTQGGPDRMIPVGDYQMPQFGNPMPQQPVPQPPMQANAQMPQAAPMQQQGGNFLDKLNAGFQSLGNGGSIIGALTGNHTDPASKQQNLTIQALRARGVPEADIALAASNPEIMKALLPRLWPQLKPHNVGNTVGAWNEATGKFAPQYSDPKTEKVSAGESLVSVNGTTATPISGLPAPQPKFDDVASIRKEVGGLPEVKRYAEAAPIYRSMQQSRDVNTAAADLDFVYGVAKIFDPESVVREGEMKLVGKAQSLPEDIKGMMGQVAMAKGRLTPEARQRILEVAQTRMNELRGAFDTRVKPYGEIAGRFNMRPEDVLPSVPDMPALSPLKPAAPTAPQGAVSPGNYMWMPGKGLVPTK